ncbi:cytochrome c oxidase subunit VB-domain-containing protein [Clohesyomyces aquaticus]|uniref:Cytochrome c oxidase subunit 4, mitochondrial n=1 Tax=Clohesyomyces aquaticus TaxID=1231657 RepID=A0A1Y1ZEL5_9PLEO|nr:cytochrome c oxidase subunit VB-domain-containing protein [Clohesyomyces aquaticus]
MFLQRSAVAAVRRAAPRLVARRTFTSSIVRRNADAIAGEDKKTPPQPPPADSSTALHSAPGFKKLEEIRSEEDLFGPGAKPGTVPTDIEQSTGLERLEILGKMQGVDIFDMKPLPSDRLGTVEEPVVVNSAGDDQYVGCTGVPADSHNVLWISLSREEPTGRCMECGSVYKMHYIGPADDPHAHGHHHEGAAPPRPKNMSDFIKPEYL